MKKLILFLFIISNCNLKAQNLMLFDGETPNIQSCVFDYGAADSLNAYSGSWCFKAIPDQWHSPTINLLCQHTLRSDISHFNEIWFYAKANIAGHSFRFYTSGWPYQSRKIDILPYIQGGILDTTYHLVRIP